MTGVAGVVLAGGRSARMGTPKAWLGWHGSTLLRRVSGLVARSVGGPVIVVRAPGQRLPALAPDVEVVEDPREGLGPLQGLAAGLAAAADRSASAAFVCSTDMPLLHPLFVRRVVAALRDGVDVAMPVVDDRPQPLAAAYRTALAVDVARWLDEGERRLTAVAARVRVATLCPGDLLADPALAAKDPTLASLRNLNRPRDYDAAHAIAPPAVTVFLRATATAPRRTEHVRAATVGDAMVRLGSTMDDVLVELDGDLVTDAATPLVDGDEIVAEAPRTRVTRTGAAEATPFRGTPEREGHA